MKVLLINNFHYLRGGSERAYFDTGKILEEHGHEVAYFSTRNRKNIPTKWENYFIEDDDLGTKHSIGSSIRIALKIIYNFEAKKQIKKLLDDFQPDIVHLHNIYHHLSPSIIGEIKKQKIPLVMTLHDYKLISPSYNLFLNGEIWEKSLNGNYFQCVRDKCVQGSSLKSLVCSLEAYLHKKLGFYDKIDKFTSPSEFLKNKFKSSGFNGPISFLPNPLPEMSGFDSDGNVTHSNDYILYYGRLSEEKGVDDLIEAYSKLSTEKLLIIVGAGPDKEKLQNLAITLGKEDKIHFTGYKEGGELWNLVKNASLVVMPSKWMENAPYCVMEAMLLTRIVLCANIGGFTELIKNGVNGYLYEHKNKIDLQAKMQDIIDNHDELASIGQEARNYVLTKNGREKYYKELLNIYEFMRINY
jgi:glycosyltransferase involved in cell wall biosynthesis